jgi:Protein of unknown function (DUF1588)/Protein of unknown function (DUF1592)/Protein of unknown function (DUF1595)/Protein of unknown function (DUF1585)/Protein of unknown function (DUF1587)
MRKRSWLTCVLMGTSALIAACSGGSIGDPQLGGPSYGGSSERPGPGSGPNGTASPGAPGSNPSVRSPNGASGSPGGAVEDPAGFEPAPAALRRLTVDQYQNSLDDLLGVKITLTTELEPDTAQNGFYAIGAARATISPAAAEKFELAAYEAAKQALAPDRRAAFVGCTPKAMVDTECTRQFVEKLGGRAYRRPLTAAESTRFVAVAETAQQSLGDFHAGLEFAVAGLLQSPNFLFRVELGEPDPANAKRLRYTDYELASRLAYTLWNTTPDATLLDAAARGELTSDAGLVRESARLIADARAQAALDNFQAERLGLSDLANLSKADSVYKGLTDDLRNALRDDVLRTLSQYTQSGQDFLDLFETKTAFVTPALAAIYGVTMSGSGTALAKVELPDSAKRMGLLGKPAFLALNAHSNETSPTLRGKYIRERMLCQSIGAPPPNVVPVLGEPDPNAPTMRDRLKAHATDVSCASCHSQMDPLGLALEHFDAIGRYRADDNGHALDTTGTLDGQDFDGAIELSQLLRDDPRAAACVARQLYRYATAHVESEGETSEIDALVDAFETSGHDFRGLMTQVVQGEGFRFAAKEASP